MISIRKYFVGIVHQRVLFYEEAMLSLTWNFAFLLHRSHCIANVPVDHKNATIPHRSKRLSSSSSRFTTAFAHINPVDGLNNGGDPQEPQQQPPQLDRAGEQPQPQDSPQHPLHPQTPHHPTPSPQHQHRTAQQQQPQQDPQAQQPQAQHQPQQPETCTPEDPPQQQHQPAAQQAHAHNNDEETMEILLLPEHPEDNTNAMATSPLPPDDASTSDAENSISTKLHQLVEPSSSNTSRQTQ